MERKNSRTCSYKFWAKKYVHITFWKHISTFPQLMINETHIVIRLYSINFYILNSERNKLSGQVLKQLSTSGPIFRLRVQFYIYNSNSLISSVRNDIYLLKNNRLHFIKQEIKIQTDFKRNLLSIIMIMIQRWMRSWHNLPKCHHLHVFNPFHRHYYIGPRSHSNETAYTNRKLIILRNEMRYNSSHSGKKEIDGQWNKLSSFKIRLNYCWVARAKSLFHQGCLQSQWLTTDKSHYFAIYIVMMVDWVE